MRKAGWRFALCCCAVLCMAGANSVSAQNYPSKVVRVIVPFPAGGPVDIIARLVCERLGVSLGQTFVIDNRAGAGSAIGSDIVAKAAPDGYILLMQASSHAILPAIQPKLPYDAIKDFAPVSLVATGPLLLQLHPSVNAKSVGELIALARTKPGGLTYASASTGSANHLAGELFKELTNTDILHVPYKGAAPATQALLAGEVNILFNNMPSGLPHIKAGTVRTLAVTSPKRAQALPDLPTLSESGVPGFDVQTWYGMLAPAGTAPVIVNKLRDEIAKALSQPEMKERFASLGLEPVASTPEQFDAYIKSEVPKWTRVARISGAKAE